VEQLAGSDAEHAVRDAHAAWCLDLAEAIHPPTCLSPSQQGLWRLEVEHANLRAALDWFERRGDRERLLRLATALSRFWFLHGHFEEGRSWLERALSDPGGIAAVALARAQVGLGQLLFVQGQRERGELLIERGIEIFRSPVDALLLSNALVWKARILIAREEYGEAEAMLRGALDWTTTIPDSKIALSAAVRVHAHLGVVAHERGDLETARGWHERALRSHRELDDVLGVIRSLRDIGDVACDQSDFSAALAAYRECLALQGLWGDPFVVVNALAGSALIAAAWGQPEPAARLQGAAAAAREQFRVGTDLPSERALTERTAALIRAAVGEPAFRAAWQAGRGLSLAAAIAEVDTVKMPASATQRGGDLGLSPREEEVLSLLIAGQSGRQIADALSISVRTVEGHVANLLAKLGVRTRAEAVLVAVAAGIA
jgi:DNA-binding CsgD family transcriptional regulator/tetratricopeptide (TPR) repeat protein